MNDIDFISWQTLEDWSPKLFFLAAIFSLVYVLNGGLAFLVESYTFNDWLGLAVLLGRWAALSATAGLSVQLVKRSPRLGKASRAVAALAIVVASALLALAILQNAGSAFAFLPVIGISTFALSAITFSLFGVAILRTGAYATLVGGFLLAVALVLLIIFIGQQFVPVGLIGALEGLLALLYFGIGYGLQRRTAQAEQRERPLESPAT
jgi:hypothetical protein